MRYQNQFKVEDVTLPFVRFAGSDTTETEGVKAKVRVSSCYLDSRSKKRYGRIFSFEAVTTRSRYQCSHSEVNRPKFDLSGLPVPEGFKILHGEVAGMVDKNGKCKDMAKTYNQGVYRSEGVRDKDSDLYQTHVRVTLYRSEERPSLAKKLGSTEWVEEFARAFHGIVVDNVTRYVEAIREYVDEREVQHLVESTYLEATDAARHKVNFEARLAAFRAQLEAEVTKEAREILSREVQTFRDEGIEYSDSDQVIRDDQVVRVCQALEEKAKEQYKAPTRTFFA